MLTFNQVIERLRDGHSYRFGNDALLGHFYKAASPSLPHDFKRDGAHSAITFWRNGFRASPTLMLYDFDDRSWWCKRSDSPTED